MASNDIADVEEVNISFAATKDAVVTPANLQVTVPTPPRTTSGSQADFSGWLGAPGSSAADSHLVGSFRAPDGSEYYGTLKGGIPEGLGTCIWSDGRQYDGEWKAGQMHGLGTFVWNNGQRYDGEWKNGKREGVGVKTYADGATYDGFWKADKKHGLGVFRPAARDRLNWQPLVTSPSKRVTDADSECSTREPEPHAMELSPTPPVECNDSYTNELEDGKGTVAIEIRRRVSMDAAVVLIREYAEGRKVREDALNAAQIKDIFGFLWPKRGGKMGARVRRVLRRTPRLQKKMGELIYKGHHSHSLMLCLQLGIRYSSGRGLAPHMAGSGVVRAEDFKERVKVLFPSAGSPTTPAHPSVDFKFKDYCPRVFRRLRQLWGCDDAEYMLSLAGSAALRQLNTPGKSGSVFFLSEDDKFLVKTMRRSECKLLARMLPEYYKHVEVWPNTLITHFYGLHRITPLNGHTVRFVVMTNVFQTELHIHRKFDIKGSTLGRSAYAGPDPDASIILKDLDLDVALELEPQQHNMVMTQISADANFLREVGVMDYSLLLGIHDPRRNPYRTTLEGQLSLDNATGAALADHLRVGSMDGADVDGLPVTPIASQLSMSTHMAAALAARLGEGEPATPLSPDRRMSDNELPGGERAAGVCNFDLLSTQAELDEVLSRVEARMRELGFSEQRMRDVLGLARLRMLGSKLRKRSARRDHPAGVLNATARARQGGAPQPQPSSGGGAHPLPGHARLKGIMEGLIADEEEEEGIVGGSPIGAKELSPMAPPLPPSVLGANMTAVAISKADPSVREEVVVCFGIIDILQDYSLRKTLERSWKGLREDRTSISVAPPGKYAQRFLDFITAQLFKQASQDGSV